MPAQARVFSAGPFRAIRITFMLVLALLSANAAQAISPNVVISQVYGGGGNSGATLRNDFIELFNRGAAPVSLAGFSVQYASATGATWQKTDLTAFTLNPGQYYLVQEAMGAGGTANLPTPDATGTIPMGGTGGKIALVSNTTLLTGVCPTVGVVDLVGFGAANCFEGAGPPAPSNTTAVIRGGGGCTDTDNNSTDFVAGAPAPRNSSTPVAVCGGAPPAPTLSINDVSQAEGNSGTTIYNFTVTLSAAAPAGGVTFNIATSDSTATVASGDYVAASAVGASIPAGATTFNFAVTVNGDALAEPTETFLVTITNISSNAVAGDVSGLGTISNDDAVVTTPISQVQGAGSSSPRVGATVTIRGVITGIKPGNSGGYYVQSPDAEVDGDPLTSEGVFVFRGATGNPVEAAIGSLVTVTGVVAEFIPTQDPTSPPLTELTNTGSTLTVLSTGNPLPSATVITAADGAPTSGGEQYERFEGMRVTTTLTVVAPTAGTVSEPNATATSNGVFYGVVSGVSRPFREPGTELGSRPTGTPAGAPVFDGNREKLRVDSDAQPGTTPLDLVAGQTVTLTGNVDFGFREYTILREAATAATVSGSAVAVPVPVPTSSELTIGSFNLERFFDTVNDLGTGPGTAGSDDVVLTQTAVNNRLNKASLAIRNVLNTPDVLGVVEVENLSILQQLATKINNDAAAASQPNPMYVAFLEEGNDIGGIDNGFLVKSSKVTVISVTQEGKTTTFVDPADGSVDILNDRPPLRLEATTQRPNGQSYPFTVIVNHNRSLSGANTDDASGQRIRAKRRAQAEFLANLVQARQVANPTERILLVGDFNAFQFNDGLVDVIGTIRGVPTPADQVLLVSPDLVNPNLTNVVDLLAADQRYSFVFDGNAQTLDHVLANDDFMTSYSRTAFARLNGDFPGVFRSDPNRPERVSDHDAIVSYFNLIAGRRRASTRMVTAQSPPAI